MVTKRFTLGLCRDYSLTKQFYGLLWGQQKSTTSEEEWSCEEVSKWAATIKRMTDDIGPSLVRSGVNESVFLYIQRYNLTGGIIGSPSKVNRKAMHRK